MRIVLFELKAAQVLSAVYVMLSSMLFLMWKVGFLHYFMPCSDLNKFPISLLLIDILKILQFFPFHEDNTVNHRQYAVYLYILSDNSNKYVKMCQKAIEELLDFQFESTWIRQKGHILP